MPTINYDATGDATEAERDAVLSAARGWQNGQDKILNSVDLRRDVDAVHLSISWTVADGEVDATITALDGALAGFAADLPPASDAATVKYE